MIKKFAEKNTNYFYLVFRLLIGTLFFLHGWMKVSNIMAGKLNIISLMGVAGVIEVVAGILIIIGLFVRCAALISAIEMLVAFFKVHLPGGLNPLKNGGESAVLFFVAFLILLAFGARKWALDKK